MTIFVLLAHDGYRLAGYIPDFLSDDDPRPAREQFNANYRHGGWRPIPGFELSMDKMVLTYPGDPPFHPVGLIILHGGEEKVYIYKHGLVCILHGDDTFEVARLD